MTASQKALERSANMSQAQSELGVVGLGVMGRNLLLNMAEHGFSAAGYDVDPLQVEALQREAGSLPAAGVQDVPGFCAALRKPRAIILLVPSGKIVDSVIADLLPYLEKGDLVIDSGNSHFRDTERRQTELEARGLNFFGMGISGGESGARHGPSLMLGGAQQAYARVQPVLEAAAARVDGEPCAAYLGPRSAGHYVKMVHNGIEYAIMQLIAESYDLLKRGLQLSNDTLSDLFAAWDRAELNSYLVEISARIFKQKDEISGERLVDKILDAARQKGTGQWASQDALNLHVPTPAIDAAVALRSLSGLEEERSALAARFGVPRRAYQGERPVLVEQIRGALYAGMLLAYAQGMAQLRAASQAYGYNLDLSTVARIWRGGCIIRSALLEPIRAAYSRRPDLAHLLSDEVLGNIAAERTADLRKVVQTAADLELPAPGMMASLAYFDSLRAGKLPTNLIQAQRDYFGAHTYERSDMEGSFHTEWAQEDN